MRLHQARERQEILTGIVFIDPEGRDFIERLNLVDLPLASLSQEQLRPSPAMLEEMMEELR
jgi:2-oxoglutarate ferredoxin oxidoreductase subunit beta